MFRLPLENRNITLRNIVVGDTFYVSHLQPYVLSDGSMWLFAGVPVHTHVSGKGYLKFTLADDGLRLHRDSLKPEYRYIQRDISHKYYAKHKDMIEVVGWADEDS